MSFDAPEPQVQVQPAMPAAPPPVLAPQGAKPKRKPQQPTFLGADSTPSGMGTPSGNMGGKTLMGV